MAGTRATPPPMPRRPTSTPTPSPSRRMMNVMVTGLLCAYRLDEADQALLSSSLRPPAATCVEQAVTLGNARLFLFVRNLLYLLVFVTSAVWPAGGCGPPPTRYPRKPESLDPPPLRVSPEEEGPGTQAHTPRNPGFPKRADP